MHADKLYQVLDAYLCVHNHSGYTVKEIRCDQQFETMMDTAEGDLGVYMNHTSDGEH